MRRTFSIEVRGKKREWSFEFLGDEKHWQDWLDDGLNVTEVVNSTPDLIFGLGLENIWIFIQNILRH